MVGSPVCMARKHVRAIIFGPQGSGKSTQGRLLADWFDIPWISSGDLFRQEIEEKSPLGKLVEEYVAHGMLAPDEVVQAIMKKRLSSLDVEKGFVLDGYPRNIEQAEVMDKFLRMNLAVQIKLSDEEAVHRLAKRLYCPACHAVYHEVDAPPALPSICSVCQGALKRRDDDREDIVRSRLMAYHFMTEPMASYYRQRGVLLAINGEQAIPSLFQELVRKMSKLGFSN